MPRVTASLFIQTRRARRGGGFTVPELAAVIVITAILGAVTTPSLLRLDDARAAIAARQALRDLTYARQRAIATGTGTWVTFDVGAQTWSVLAEDPDNPGRAGATVIDDFATGRPYTQVLAGGFFPNTHITAINIDSNTEVGFDWLGQPLNAAGNALMSAGLVTLTGGHVVRIEPGTGHTRYLAP